MSLLPSDHERIQTQAPHTGRDQLREQRGHPWPHLLFASGALLSNATLFTLKQELRQKSPLLWDGRAWQSDVCRPLLLFS